MYTREQIDELKSKIDYFEFYSKYLPDLTQKGKLAWACCPFHGDKHPSLSVDVSTGLFRCWSCSTYGDCFTFYQKNFNISFQEAVEEIAEIYNFQLTISDEELSKREYKKQLHNINNIMCNKFQLCLKSNTNAYNYLTQIRGFSPKVIEEFRLGCGINKLPVKDSLIELGLLIKTEDNKHYAKFSSNRITIPFFDERGNITSFVGRLHIEDPESKYKKYMYTTDTSIHKKSDIVFGLYQAKKYIKHFNSVIICEGQLDVIKCHQKGIVNSVAMGGLNISDAQINLLKKYTSNFYICVEDKAILTPNSNDHKSQLDKFYEKIKQNVPYAKVYIIDLRDGDKKCDPDEYLNSHTRAEFSELVKHAKIYNEFIINEKLKTVNPKNIEEKTKFINIFVPILNNISNYLDRKQYIELVANKLCVSENDIYRKIKYYTDNKDKKISVETFDNRPIYAQKILLSTCFCPNFSNVRAVADIKLYAVNLLEPFYKNIFLELIYPYVAQKQTSKVDFKDFFNDLIYNENISELVKKTVIDIYMKIENFEDFEESDLDDLIKEQIETLREYSIPTEQTSLSSTLENSKLESVGVDT